MIRDSVGAHVAYRAAGLELDRRVNSEVDEAIATCSCDRWSKLSRAQYRRTMEHLNYASRILSAATDQ